MKFPGNLSVNIFTLEFKEVNDREPYQSAIDNELLDVNET